MTQVKESPEMLLASIDLKLAEAKTIHEYIIVRKINTLLDILMAEKPNEANGIGSETTYTPCISSERLISTVENKILELVKTL